MSEKKNKGIIHVMNRDTLQEESFEFMANYISLPEITRELNSPLGEFIEIGTYVLRKSDVVSVHTVESEVPDDQPF